MKTSRLLWLALIFSFAFSNLQARAQDDQDQGQDPPSRVARLNYSTGSVSFQPGGEGDWVAAVPNRPLTTGDNLWADQNSRAELHVGSTAIRMNSQTSLTFLDLDDRTMQLRLSLGSLILRVRHLDDGDLVEVDTPNLAFTIQRTGEYRIDVNQDGNQTIATVWKGRAEATGGSYSYAVIGGQTATFSGTDQLDHEIAQISPSDDFDEFAFTRDSREDRDESSNYISTEMTGYEDLDENGHWHYAADYGPVWTPVGVAAGWAPYRFGHWAWVAPWGWTWVEDEPWGFAPFHYGRWAFVESSWCWVPGPVVVRPVYAPALVAFVGGGGFNLAIGVGGAGVAWFPLGPREVYVPPYRVSRVYVNNINITNTRVNVTQVTNVYNNTYINRTNVTNVTNVNRIAYMNQHVNGAVTAVSHDTFVNARPVSRNLAQVNGRELENAPVSHEVPVQPARQSVLGAGAPSRARPPAAIENRQVIATRNPTPPRAPFEQQQRPANVRTEPIRPNAPAEMARPNEPANVPRAAEPARPAEPANAERPNEPARPSEPANVPRPNAPNRPEEPSQPARAEAPRPAPGNVPRPPQAQGEAQRNEPQRSYQQPQQPTHPLVRPAQPAERSPQVEQNEANKFRTWQQQRPPQPPPQRASAPRAPANRPAPKQEERKK